MTDELADLLVIPGRDSTQQQCDLAGAFGAAQEDKLREIGSEGFDERLVRLRALFTEVRDQFRPVDLWELFAYAPSAVASELSITPERRWSTLVDLFTAWHELAVERQVPGVDGRSAELGAGCLARTRWLLLSVPARARDDLLQRRQTHRGWQPIPLVKVSPVAPVLEQERIPGWVTQARRAREDWLTVLGSVDDYLPLSKLDVEAEAAEMALIRLDEHDEQARTAIGEYIATRLLLPRFSWGFTRRILGRGATVLWSCGAVLAVLALVIFALECRYPHPHAVPRSLLEYRVPIGLAFLTYAVVGVGAALNPANAWLWLLRQPAGAAVGLLALAALPADWWWRNDPSLLNWSSALLIAVGAGYLLTELGNHGVRGPALLRRTAGVLACGLLQSFLISLVGLRTIVPAFSGAPSGSAPRLSCWWQVTGCGPNGLLPWQLVLTATAWSFVVGVFLQIIWDDQPVTAPLTHARWRRGDQA